MLMARQVSVQSVWGSERHCIPGIGLTDVDDFYGHGKVLK